jgi:hypothetical protein
MAASEGMRATGIDQGGFRTGENSIHRARALWGDLPFGSVEFHQQDIMSYEKFFYHDVIMMFSTWPYIANCCGREMAEDLIGRIVRACGTFFFETQLYGDGPGPEFLKTDADVEAMLRRFGHVTNVATFPVTGRPASRTVWKVEARA